MNTSEDKSIACPRCDGTGRFGGGVCFNCKGACRVKARPVAKGYSWKVFACERETGAKISVFRLKALTAETALARAKAQLARGTGYDPETTQVERVRP